MQAEHEQIITHGYTRSSDWQELAQRSINTRRKIDLQCPLCSAEIHPTRNGAPQGTVPRHSFDTTDLRCRACDAPVEVYQHREITETADTRIIYAEVSNAPFFAPQGAGFPRHSAPRRARLTLDLQCLSCERTLQADETCTNTCRIQTYLTLEHQDGELYIKRAANLPHVPRDTPFIPIRNLPPNANADTDTPETLNSVENSVYNSVQSVSENSVNHSDADPPNQPLTRENSVPWHAAELTGKQRICEYLIHVNAEHTATTGDIRKALNLAASTFDFLIKPLISDGQVEKIAYGVYRLRT